jgi:hypothetical protein
MLLVQADAILHSPLLHNFLLGHPLQRHSRERDTLPRRRHPSEHAIVIYRDSVLSLPSCARARQAPPSAPCNHGTARACHPPPAGPTTHAAPPARRPWALRSARARCTSRTSSGANPSVGSSINSRSELVMSARPIASICHALLVRLPARSTLITARSSPRRLGPRGVGGVHVVPWS